MEETVLEDLAQEPAAPGRNASDAPLYKIREKEMEISGRILAAKQEAESIVAEGRRKSAEMISAAGGEAEALARQHEAQRLTDAQADAVRVRETVGQETAPIEATIAQRRGSAVDEVVRLVTEV